MTYLVPNSPTELGFNEDTYGIWRAYQKYVVERILNTDKKLVVVAAPTGAGKSAIALACGRILAALGKKVSILTPRINLQEQYMGYKFTSGEQLKLATGRANHPCVLEEVDDGTMADTAPCTEGYQCPHSLPTDENDLSTISCPYYRQRSVADEARLRTLNYPMFFNQTGMNKLFSGNELVICDEGHDIDTHILNAAAVTLTPSDFTYLRERHDMVPPKVYQPLLALNPQIVKWAREAIGNVGGKPIDRKQSEIYNKLSKLLFLADGKTTVIEVKMDGRLIRFSPAICEEVAQRVLLGHTRKLVLMSATIFGPEYWADRLGVDREDVEWIEIPSSFPVENRRVHYIPTAMVNHKAWSNEAEMMKVIRGIDWAITRHLPQKGLVHSVSYRLGNFIQANSQYQEIMIVGGGDKLEEFIKTPIGVYVSPSAIEGLDLADELCRFVIFPKVPYLSMDDPVIKVQMELIPEFYTYKAMSSIIQGAGRGMRHEGDSCLTYILDKNFARVYMQTKGMLPKWFVDALDWRKDVPWER